MMVYTGKQWKEKPMSHPHTTRIQLVFVASLALSACKKKPVPTPEPVLLELPDEDIQGEDAVIAVPESVTRMVQNFQRLHFEFDSDSLSDEAIAALSENVEIMQEHGDIKLQLQGHADERGTTDYNLALGQKRAHAVQRYMEASGVSGSRLTVTSYGEEAPLVSGASEQAWTQNRRCEFIITWGGGSTVRSSDQ
jgi:peptidoglycan-associated lipoprotein